jgi:hypothetical protein
VIILYNSSNEFNKKEQLKVPRSFLTTEERKRDSKIIDPYFFKLQKEASIVQIFRKKHEKESSIVLIFE